MSFENAPQDRFLELGIPTATGGSVRALNRAEVGMIPSTAVDLSENVLFGIGVLVGGSGIFAQEN